MTAPASSSAAAPAPAARATWIWRVALLVWGLMLCFVPDPRPLGAPDWAVGAARTLTGVGEAPARALATLALRVGGIALLGALCMLALGGRRWTGRSAGVLLLAPALALVTLWINYGYFPIRTQIQIAVISAALGAIAGLALRRNLVAAAAVVSITAGLFAWGSATGIPDELDAATRAVGRHVLAEAERIPDGDEGFARLIEVAFSFAEDNSHGTDPIEPNKAAVLALGVILGEEQIADVAGRHIDRSRLPEAEALRDRITLYGRKDWPRHFWVSAALTLLSDADRSIAVGITKELMDTSPGGTGFSFPDLAADAAGNRFALAATRDAESARRLQAMVMGGVAIGDVFPDMHDLPEGLTRERFTEDFGGLGGEKTGQVVAEILRRLDGCELLR